MDLRNFFVYVIVTISMAAVLTVPVKDEEEVNRILLNYFKKIPNIETQYVINEGISRAISNFYNGTVNTFPLYKISLKIDPTPVKIPWTLEKQKEKNTSIKKRYKYIKVKAGVNNNE